MFIKERQPEGQARTADRAPKWVDTVVSNPKDQSNRRRQV